MAQVLKYIRLIFIIAAILPAFSTANAAKSLLKIQHWTTSQGTPVYFVNTPGLPMIDIQIIFNAGSAYDQNHWGLAEMTTNLLEEGTTQHNADQIALAFDQTGAQFNNTTTRDVTIVALRSLTDPKYFSPALHTFTEVLSQANFPQTAIDRVKQQTIAAIQQEKQDPESEAINTFYKTLYPAQGYGHPVLGTMDRVNSLSKNLFQDFYQHYFVAHNAKIVIVGNLTRSQAESTANQCMSALPQGEAAAKLPLAQSKVNASTINVSFPSQQTTLIIGQLGIDRQDPRYFPLMVGNYIFGQMPLGSVLFEQIRNTRGLAYGASSNFQLLTSRGPFYTILQTRAAESSQALQIANQSLKDFLTQGPTPAQLQLAKQNIINAFPLSLATNADIASVLAQMVINQRPLNYLDTYQDNINAVTAEQIKKDFQQLINPNQMITVSVGQSSGQTH